MSDELSAVRRYERGVIRSREYAAQLRDFKALKWGRITPTDIDGFLDFHGRLFVFFESKYSKASVGLGQRIAFERLCDACHNETRTAIFFLCSHESAVGQDIDFSVVTVTEYRFAQRWHKPKSSPLLLLDAINRCRVRFL